MKLAAREVELSRVFREHRVKIAYLFGSQAEGSAGGSPTATHIAC